MSIFTLIVFFCSFLYGLSAVLCKYGLQQQIDVKHCSIRQILRFVIVNKFWIIGVLISFLANIIIIEIQSVIDISVVYPILNFSYVFTLILGYFFLREILDKTQFIGIATVIIGTALIIFIDEPATGGDTDFQRLFLVSFISAMTIGFIVYYVHKNNIENYEIPYALCTGICFSNVESLVKTNTNLVTSELGYFTVFSIESISYFISLWPFYMLIVFSIVGWIFMQITYSHGNVSVTVPVFAVLQSTLTIISGYFVYSEVIHVEKFMGVLTIIVGVTIIVLSTIQKKVLKAV